MAGQKGGVAPGKTCYLCKHPRRDEFDLMIATSQYTTRQIADKAGVTSEVVRRHKNHVSVKAIQAVEKKEESRKQTLVKRLERLWEAADKGVEAALSKDLKVLPGVLGQAHRNIELDMELHGLKGEQQGAGGSIVVIIPTLAPLGEPADLRVRIPQQAIEEAQEGRKGLVEAPIEDAEWEDLPQGSESEEEIPPAGKSPNSRGSGKG